MAPMSLSDRCSLDNNPLGDLCRFINDHAGGPVAGPILTRLLWALALLLVIVVSGRIVRGITGHALERSRADAQVRTLVRNVFAAATTVIAILAALTAVGLPISVLLTFGGLGTLAIGFAFQDLLRNVLAGIFLLVERPFVIGDLITVGSPPSDLTGNVQTIELRTTSLRLSDGRLAVIPNLNAFSSNVINANAYDLRQYTVSVWLSSDSDVEAAMRTARGILEAQPEVEDEPPPKVVPDLVIDVGVTLKCQYWLRYRDSDPDTVAAALVQRISAELLVERGSEEAAP
jgi:small conductance mechanosensitive channel